MEFGPDTRSSISNNLLDEKQQFSIKILDSLNPIIYTTYNINPIIDSDDQAYYEFIYAKYLYVFAYKFENDVFYQAKVHCAKASNLLIASKNSLHDDIDILYAILRSYLWYVADGEISMQSIALGASKVPFIKGTQKVKETIKPDDLAALLAAPSDRSKIGIRDKTILILLYDSAIRVSELRELTLESLKLNETIPYIRVHGKGDKERIVSITDKTVEHLKRYIKIYHSETNGDYPLFYTVIKGNLSAMSTGNVERILNKYAEKIRPDHPGLPQKLYPHMLRRTRACGLYQNGVELELVSRILGHTSTQTTRIYASPSIEMLKKAMENNSVDVSETAEWLDDEEELARICGIR